MAHVQGSSLMETRSCSCATAMLLESITGHRKSDYYHLAIRLSSACHERSSAGRQLVIRILSVYYQRIVSHESEPLT